MPKLTQVTIIEALDLINSMNHSGLVHLEFVDGMMEFLGARQETVKDILIKNIRANLGESLVLIHFEGIEDLLNSFDSAMEILDSAQELSEFTDSYLGIETVISYNRIKTKFTYTISYLAESGTALIFANMIKGEIIKSAHQRCIFKKVTVLLEEGEGDDYHPNDEAEQDR
jgi:hypothetical protein